MNMCSLGLTLQRSLEHLLGRDILTAVQFDHAAIVERIGITRENAFSSQSRLCDREICPRASCDFGNLRVFIYQDSKLIPRLSKPTSRKLLVGPFKRCQGSRLILCGRSRHRRSWLRSNCSDCRELLRRFDPWVDL